MNDVSIKLYAITTAINSSGFETKTETYRTVYAERLSVTGQDFYNAYNSGVRLDYVFRMRAAEYHEEQEIEYSGGRYDIVRSYIGRQGEYIDLTAKRK